VADCVGDGSGLDCDRHPVSPHEQTTSCQAFVTPDRRRQSRWSQSLQADGLSRIPGAGARTEDCPPIARLARAGTGV